MINIEKATKTHFSTITDIYQHYILKTAATFEEKAPNSHTLFKRAQKNPNHPYLVAIQDNTVLGYAYVSPYHNRYAYRFCVENSVYVHANHLGKGIGKALLEDLLTASRDAGFKEVIARIAMYGSKASIHLHKKLGFVEVGTLKNVGFKFNTYIDTLIMQKSLKMNTKPYINTRSQLP